MLKNLECTISFQTNRDNKNYLMVQKAELFSFFAMTVSYEVDNKVLEEVRRMHSAFSYSNIGFVDQIAIRKDNIVGDYLLNHYDQVRIINDDELVRYSKICNALLFAQFQKNLEMVSQILPLFEREIEGNRADLINLYVTSPSVVQYILEHDDFQDFLFKKNHHYSQIYAVYEDGQFIKKVLTPNYGKIKERKKDK